MFSHVTDTLNGLQTIRSSSALIKVSHEFDTFQVIDNKIIPMIKNYFNK